jgi:methylmalonyl-CoA mutase cobalamin-binding domain/chain
MKAGMGVLKPLMTAKAGDTNEVGRVLMGTVRGDLHDIGKNLVCMMAEGAGFVVKDIGVDQSVEKFMAAADEFKPNIIGMSALLTTTMTYMKTVIDGFEAAGRTDIKMAIGGAPISQMFADEIGADGYGSDASNAVDLFMRLVGKGDDGPADVPMVKGRATPVVASPITRDPNAQSKYQVLYWQDLPSQIKVWDDFEERKLDLPSPFPDRIDAAAQRLGLASGDAYIAQLRWGPELTKTGSPDDVLESVVKELKANLN